MLLRREHVLLWVLLLVVILALVVHYGLARRGITVLPVLAVGGGSKGRGAERSRGRKRSGAAPPLPSLAAELDPPAEMFARLRAEALTLPLEQPGAVVPAKSGTAAKTRKYAAVLQREWPRDALHSDALSLHFSDKVRQHCAFGSGPSPAKFWSSESNRQLIEREARQLRAKEKMSAQASMREALQRRARWCNYFNAGFAVWALRRLAQRAGCPPEDLRVADPSAGWGDRLLAACAIGARCYRGCDPNAALKPAYAAIARQFAPRGECFTGAQRFTARVESFTVRTKGFGPGVLGAPESFDVVLTSPPFFALEDYPAEGGRAARNRTYQQWLREFYRGYLAEAWRLVRPGGCLALYVESFRLRGQYVPLAEDTCSELERLGAPEPELLGFQQVSAEADKPRREGAVRPLFVWQKPKV